MLTRRSFLVASALEVATLRAKRGRRYLTPPGVTTTITSALGANTSGTTANWALFYWGASVANCLFEWRIDGGSWTKTPLCARGLQGLGLGSHTFEVRAIDIAGLTGPAASYAWTVSVPGGGFVQATTVAEIRSAVENPANAGAVVYVRAGTYGKVTVGAYPSEVIQSPKVTLRPYPGETVTIAGIDYQGMRGLRVEGMKFSAAADVQADYNNGLLEWAGNEFGPYLGLGVSAVLGDLATLDSGFGDFVVEGNWFHDLTEAVDGIGTGGYAIHIVGGGTTERIPRVRISANRAVGPLHDDFAELIGVEDSIIEDNDVTGVLFVNQNVYGDPMVLWSGRNNIFRRNFFHSNSQATYFIHEDNLLCEDNIIVVVNGKGTDDTNGPDEAANTNLIFRYNTLWDCSLDAETGLALLLRAAIPLPPAGQKAVIERNIAEKSDIVAGYWASYDYNLLGSGSTVGGANNVIPFTPSFVNQAAKDYRVTNAPFQAGYRSRVV